MAGLPSGTVTLLFSDIEGSTLLLQRLGAQWAEALDGQRSLLRRAWSEHGGAELGTEGDSFFVAFETADAAVAAALEGQRALAGHRWPRGERVRVRMGIHTGQPLQHDGGYVGLDVHRAARIASAAHGGQVVVSQATRELASRPVDAIDLGLHYLKDLPEAERLFQLFEPGADEEFPPLKSLGTATSLPLSDDLLVGRDDELARLVDVIGGGARLVTLTGPGGSGKTRLAVALARALADRPGTFPDGVFFVPLAEATTEDHAWARLGEVLAVRAADRSAAKLLDKVAGWRALFVLDNLEQLSAADAVARALGEHAPGVVLAATSRAPLHLRAEHEHPVPPLALPDDDSLAAVERSSAGQLFAQCARRVRPRFAIDAGNAADVAAICRRLDGLPLALELSAARAKLLSPKAIAGRLDTALDLAATTRDTPGRQRTLRDTIGWSYRLLEPEAQRLFRTLGVFAGGADLAAIEAVAAPPDHGGELLDLLSDLVNASLLTVSETDDGEPRFALLETVRAFARDLQREAGELAHVQDSHLRHYAAVVARLHDAFNGPRYLEAVDAFERELDNLQQAFDWALQSRRLPGDPRWDDAQAVAVRTAYFLLRTAGRAASRSWLDGALELGAGFDHTLQVRALWVLGVVIGGRGGESERGLDFVRSAVAMGRRLDDDVELAFALASESALVIELDGPEAGLPSAQEALVVARRSGSLPALHRALMNLAGLEVERDGFAAGDLLADELGQVAAAVGDPTRLVEHQQVTTWMKQGLGRFDEAREWIEATARTTLALGLAYHSALSAIAYDFVAVLVDVGDAAGAAWLLGATDAQREREGWELPRTETEYFDRFVARGREAVSDEVWDRAYGLGRQLRLDDAIQTVDTWDRRQLAGASPE